MTDQDMLNTAARHIEDGKLDEALGIYKRILEEDPDNEEAREGFRTVYTVMLERDNHDYDLHPAEDRYMALLQLQSYFEAMLTVVKRKRAEYSERPH
ncbi:hypothetical protein JXA40_08755 [bacterium]|nr:hypothetical protein [candidate division CSSED10-310 bacterium]